MLTKNENTRFLKYLLPVWVLTGLLSLIVFLVPILPQKPEVSSLDYTLLGADKFYQSYQIGETKVGVFLGDLFTVDDKSIASGVGAIAFAAKEKLDTPKHRNSLDCIWRRDKLSIQGFPLEGNCHRFNHGDLSSLEPKPYSSDQSFIYHFSSEYWREDAGDPRNVFILAGIDARRPSSDRLSDDQKAKNRKVIRSQLPILLSNVRSSFADEESFLVLPVLNSGAAGAIEDGRSPALDDILTAINETAMQGNAPDYVAIALYPGDGEADSAITGEFNRVVESGIFSERYNLWKFAQKQTILVQLAILVFAVVSSAIVAAVNPKLPIILSWGSISVRLLGTLALAFGIVNLSTWEPVGIQVRSWDRFWIIAIVAFLVPLWSWHRFGETVERTN